MVSMTRTLGKTDRRPQGGSFGFVSSYLTQSGAVFARTAAREAVLRFDFGGNQATVPLSTVPAAAELSADHPDLSLLRFVEPALLYREEITAGAPIPSELVTGQPSWTATQRTMDRVLRQILEALSASSTGAAALSAQDASEAIAKRLIGVDTRKDVHVVELIQKSLEAAGCAMDLRGAVTNGQRVVGELATLSASKAPFTGQDRLRDAALRLRTVMVWATNRTLELDMLANDIRATLADPERLRSRIWPAINELRAWNLDLAPVLRTWRDADHGSRDLRLGDIEDLHRLVSIRFAQFDPEIYRPMPVPIPSGSDRNEEGVGHGE